MKHHPNKEISAAIQYAIERGWTYTKGNNYGALWCPNECRCRMSVWSTPKKPQDFAKRIRRTVDKCPTGQPPRHQTTEPTTETEQNEGEAKS